MATALRCFNVHTRAFHTCYRSIFCAGVTMWSLHHFHRRHNSVAVRADDGILSSVGGAMTAMSPVGLVNALKLETTGYGNQLLHLLKCSDDGMSFKQSWGDYFSRYVKIYQLSEGVRELHVAFDESVSRESRKKLCRNIMNHININGGITPKQIANIIQSEQCVMTTTKDDKGTVEENQNQNDVSWSERVWKYKDFRLVDINITVYGNEENLPQSWPWQYYVDSSSKK